MSYFYKHYRNGQLYEKLHDAIMEHNRVEVVVYKDVLTNSIYVRPKFEFNIKFIPVAAQKSEIDPVHYENGGWWFWDETWATRLGPWPTEDDARAHLKVYCNQLG